MSCRTQLVELQQAYAEVSAQNAEVLAISTDDLSGAQWVIENLGIPFPVLYDQGDVVPRAYDVFNRFGDGLATGSVFLVDTQGVIRWAQVYTHAHDLVPAQGILDGLRAL